MLGYFLLQKKTILFIEGNQIKTPKAERSFMIKKMTLLALLSLVQITANAITSFPLARGTDQGRIINTIYSVGAAEKLTLLLVINDDYIKPKEKEAILWMLENVQYRLSDFWYCQHELEHPEQNCKCMSHKKDPINYAYLTSFEYLTDLCGKAGAPVLFIFKNGQVLHKIPRDVLLSNKLLPHEKEQKIIDTITSAYKKALVSTDFNN